MAGPTAHAVLSASASHRWINCPGSIRASEDIPSGTTKFADEGTDAHEAAEQLIRKGKVDAKLRKAIKAFYEAHPELGGTVEDMIRTLEPYVEFVKEEFAEAVKSDPAAELMTEQRVDLGLWARGSFGTTDVAIIGGDQLTIIDLKYGKGVPVSAENNSQLRLYALGTLTMLEAVYDISTVKMVIYQPRLDNVSCDTISADDLREWGESVVRPAADLALTDNAPTAAGSWCQFCPARHTCRTRADYFMELAEYKKKAFLSNEEIGQILAKVDGLVKWADDLKETTLTRALHGEDFPGWKVVEGRSVRRFTGSEEEIVRQCEGAGYDRALLYETRLLTLTNIEKLLGKTQFAEILDGYYEKPQGKPTLAPESDRRPAIINQSAAEDFADE